ncbi:DMT family transporter [Streptomyces sp. NPDC047928]|uniref:DMT family transporter n=1 Tax=unclassified Streptomyces TaxID=2593676 RepID=UPI003723C74D
MSPLATSVLLSVVSAIAYAAGAIVQERVAVSASGTARPYAPLSDRAWWVAVLLNSLGALLHVAALAYGPLSLVQPLGALTIVFALPMAAMFVGRRAGATAWRGAVMATAGLAGLLALVGPPGARSLGGGVGPLLAAVSLGAMAALFVSARGVRRRAAADGRRRVAGGARRSVAAGARRTVTGSVLLAAAGGVAFGTASVFTKVVAVEWAPDAPLRAWPALPAIAVFAVAGLLLSQASYRGAGLAAPLATVTVVNPVVAAAAGLALFGEQLRYGVTGTVLAVGCGVLAAGGLIVLTTASSARPAVPEPAVAEPTTARPAVSQSDATRPQVGERVDVGAVPRPGAHLEVKVRSGAVAGGP